MIFVLGLQVVMTSVVRAMYPLMQVLFLVVFVIIIFAIIGLEFLQGRFKYACYDSAKKACKYSYVFIAVCLHLLEYSLPLSLPSVEHVCMAIYGYVCMHALYVCTLCMYVCMHGYVWLCVAMYGYV